MPFAPRRNTLCLLLAVAAASMTARADNTHTALNIHAANRPADAAPANSTAVANTATDTAAVLLHIATANAPTGETPASCAPTGVAADAEKAAILKVITDMQAAWNRGDFRGYMQGFKNPDVIFVSGGRFQDGWQGTLDHYVRDYGTSPEARGTLKFYDITVEMLAPDAAQLISHYQLVRQQHPQYGINTRLMRKVNGQWVIALNHVSSSETAPTETHRPTGGQPPKRRKPSSTASG
jgi:uncharacterized protein (TIGR02246 family)